MGKQKNKYIRLRLSESELNAIQYKWKETVTKAAQQAIEYWQTLDFETREAAMLERKHVAIDEQLTKLTIGANKNMRDWMETVENCSLNASTAIGVWLEMKNGSR